MNKKLIIMTLLFQGLILNSIQSQNIDMDLYEAWAKCEMNLKQYNAFPVSSLLHFEVYKEEDMIYSDFTTIQNKKIKHHFQSVLNCMNETADLDNVNDFTVVHHYNLYNDEHKWLSQQEINQNIQKYKQENNLYNRVTYDFSFSATSSHKQ